ncbi:MAG: hypothetical protein K0Q53_2522 [Massilibacillus sp.]|jgi:hypothetical protein|nr:hypothetical protein [Massilibacillus sp.]
MLLAKDVKCIVDSCKYYHDGDLCQANAIEVTSETKKCDCSSETNCRTFQPK